MPDDDSHYRVAFDLMKEVLKLEHSMTAPTPKRAEVINLYVECHKAVLSKGTAALKISKETLDKV